MHEGVMISAEFWRAELIKEVLHMPRYHFTKVVLVCLDQSLASGWNLKTLDRVYKQRKERRKNITSLPLIHIQRLPLAPGGLHLYSLALEQSNCRFLLRLVRPFLLSTFAGSFGAARNAYSGKLGVSCTVVLLSRSGSMPAYFS